MADYRKLCLELFGTDDEAVLRKIAKEYTKKNPRNAGRKRKITDEDVQGMRETRRSGTSMRELSALYGISRQTAERYLNAPAAEGCSMRLTYMFRKQPCTVIDVNFLERKISIQNQTDDMLHRAFGITEQPTWQDFEDFLRERCFPETRGNCAELLRDMGLTDHDPLQIIEQTKGRLTDDDMWLRVRYLPQKGSAVHGDH